MMRRAMLGAIRLYQVALSPLLGPSCRFQPTCSAYAAEAIGRFGAWRGGRLAARRLCRCHPWGGSGWDPVPDSLPGRASSSQPTNGHARPQEPVPGD